MSDPSFSGDSGSERRLNAILAEYLKRKDAGQPLDEHSLLKAYPDLADELRSYFAGEAMFGEGKRPGNPFLPVSIVLVPV